MKLQINESQNELCEVSLENIEFKQSWRDEYISAFSNTDGGKLYIGVDNDGEIKDIDNVKKLLEDISNKVRDISWIMVLEISTTAIEKHNKTLKNKILSNKLAMLKVNNGRF